MDAIALLSLFGRNMKRCLTFGFKTVLGILNHTIYFLSLYWFMLLFGVLKNFRILYFNWTKR